MIAMFNDVKEFAVFNAKPHLFSYEAPYQLPGNDAIFVKLSRGWYSAFERRVQQFGGIILRG